MNITQCFDGVTYTGAARDADWQVGWSSAALLLGSRNRLGQQQYWAPRGSVAYRNAFVPAVFCYVAVGSHWLVREQLSGQSPMKVGS